MKTISLTTLFIFIPAFLFSWSCAAPALGGGYLDVEGPCGLEFPKDHGAHPEYQTEWWYYTGNLKSADAKQDFGFQLTFFRVGISPPGSERDWPSDPSRWRTRDLFMGHAALTDPVRSRFLFDEKTARGAAGPRRRHVGPNRDGNLSRRMVPPASAETNIGFTPKPTDFPSICNAFPRNARCPTALTDTAGKARAPEAPAATIHSRG